MQYFLAKYRSLGVVVLLACAASLLVAADFSHRQYYGSWRNHSRGFSYRPYYYKPNKQFVGYKHHFVIHHPKRPKHLFFYNPYQKRFWGRCPVSSDGKAAYSLLAEKDRKAILDAIPESAFPEPGPLPPIPDSADGEVMDLPPDDLPEADALPE